MEKNGGDTKSDYKMLDEIINEKNILIVNNISDCNTGLDWIDNTYRDNIRTAVLYNDESSHNRCMPKYSAKSINKINDPQWIVFPWEA